MSSDLTFPCPYGIYNKARTKHGMDGIMSYLAYLGRWVG